MPERAEVSCARILPFVAEVTPRSRYWKNSRRPETTFAPLALEILSSIFFALADPSMASPLGRHSPDGLGPKRQSSPLGSLRHLEHGECKIARNVDPIRSYLDDLSLAAALGDLTDFLYQRQREITAGERPDPGVAGLG